METVLDSLGRIGVVNWVRATCVELDANQRRSVSSVAVVCQSESELELR